MRPKLHTSAPYRSTALIVSALLPGTMLLTGCGQSDASDLPGYATQDPAQFGEEQKQAARALSIGAAKVASSGQDPYGQAINCAVSLATVSDHLSSGDEALPAQLQAIGEAARIYETRLTRLGQEAGKSAGEIASDKAEQESAERDLRDDAQFAIGCLRKLT